MQAPLLELQVGAALAAACFSCRCEGKTELLGATWRHAAAGSCWGAALLGVVQPYVQPEQMSFAGGSSASLMLIACLHACNRGEWAFVLSFCRASWRRHGAAWSARQRSWPAGWRGARRWRLPGRCWNSCRTLPMSCPRLISCWRRCGRPRRLQQQQQAAAETAPAAMAALLLPPPCQRSWRRGAACWTVWPARSAGCSSMRREARWVLHV
jgi:hypothetical protein